MIAPVRIQRKRTKGWRMPTNTIYVGRGTMWGNYAAQRAGLTKGEVAVNIFRDWIQEEASWAWKGRLPIDLCGKNLACWCALDQPCHADVLLELANVIESHDPQQTQPSPDPK
jgi:Domain of unknown function (DUF4326)